MVRRQVLKLKGLLTEYLSADSIRTTTAFKFPLFNQLCKDPYKRYLLPLVHIVLIALCVILMYIALVLKTQLALRCKSIHSLLVVARTQYNCTQQTNLLLLQFCAPCSQGEGR